MFQNVGDSQMTVSSFMFLTCRKKCYKLLGSLELSISYVKSEVIYVVYLSSDFSINFLELNKKLGA